MSANGSSVTVGGAHRGRLICKRAIDLIGGLVLAIVTTPTVLLLLIGSAIAFRANPIFCQRRVGYRGREFRIIKIRTLPRVAPQYANRREIGDVPTNRWGSLLRRTHLDELLQLWQVVFGQMSLVGPRPMISKIVDACEPSFASARASMRPGCTGLWQVSHSANDLVHETSQYDLHYLERFTLALDVRILVLTVCQFAGSRRRHEVLPPSGVSADVDTLGRDGSDAVPATLRLS